MATRFKKADLCDKTVIRNLMQLYLHELTEYEDIPLNSSGEYEYLYLDHYWTEGDRYPYLLHKQAEIAGFAFVRKEEHYFSMAEFFILKKFRSLDSFSLKCAVNIIKQHVGEWRIEFLNNNEIGWGFWNKVALAVTSGDIKRKKLNETFDYIQFLVANS
ncbi:MAG: GNAT family N-acetyltransferase [Chloroflexota bacterium]|nr:MAG: GNAT family N-acetyltransferase [Chloroflexota bacterium]